MSPTVTNVHGIEAKIYVGDVELTEANAWSLSHSSEYTEIVKHGAGGYKERLKGAMDWSGSITVWFDQDSKTLQDIAIGLVETILMIYPKGSDPTTFYKGSCWFDFEHGSDVGSGQALTCAFFGDGALTLTGFAA